MINIKGLLSNPLAALQSSRQPGGLLAPVTSFREAVTNPRLFLAEALINRTPITEAIGNYAAVNKALEPEADTARVSKIKGLVTRLQSTNPSLSDTEALNKATDIVDGNLEIQFNPDAKTFSTFDPVTQDIRTFGGPLASKTYNPEVAPEVDSTSTSTPLVKDVVDTRTEGQKRRGIGTDTSLVIESYLGPGDFTKNQLEKHKTRISNIDEALPELKRSIEKTDNIFGISNKFARAGGNIAGITPDFIDKYLINPEVEQATQEYKLVKEKIVKQLTDNPKFPVAEVNRLLEMLPDESAIFLDPQKAKIQLTTLYNGLQTMSDNAKSALTGQAVASDPYEIPMDSTEQNPFVDQILNKYR
tara:strand:- start:1567 stop:2643 length:1077 start_codon:yes stop_codon:yes gene_type:complete